MRLATGDATVADTPYLSLSAAPIPKLPASFPVIGRTRSDGLNEPSAAADESGPLAVGTSLVSRCSVIHSRSVAHAKADITLGPQAG